MVDAAPSISAPTPVTATTATISAIADAVSGNSQNTEEPDETPDEPSSQEESTKLVERHKWTTKSKDGSAKEYDVDTKELRRGYAHMQAANEKMREVATARKDFESEKVRYSEKDKENDKYRSESKQWGTLLERIQNDPDDYLEFGRRLGHDVEKMVEEKLIRRMRREIATENGSGETLRLLDLEDKDYENSKKLKRYESSEKQREYQSTYQSTTTQLQQSIQTFQSQNPDVPEEFVKEAVQTMIDASDRGQNLSFENAIGSLVKRAEALASARSGQKLQSTGKSGQISSKPDQPNQASQASKPDPKAAFRPSASNQTAKATDTSMTPEQVAKEFWRSKGIRAR